MDKKEIQIDKNIPKSIFIGLLLAYITVFTVNHFSTFSYIPNLGKPIIDYSGKIVVSGTYDTRTTPVLSLYQTTPFGTKIDLPIDGLMCSDLIFDGSEFKSYSNKVVLYATSVFNDYKYLVLFWLAYTMIIMFFKKYRLKVLVLVLPISLISCDKTKQEPINGQLVPADTIANVSTTDNRHSTVDTTTIKHSFVVFKVKDKYFGKESVIVTGIFNTPFPLTTDEEYMILDDVQGKSNAYLFDKNILERYMMRFDSYTDASIKKEQILKINNFKNTKYSLPEDYDVNNIDSVSSAPLNN